MVNKSKESRGKRLVYVSDEPINDVLGIARKRGKTVSKFVEDAVQLAIRIHNIVYPQIKPRKPWRQYGHKELQARSLYLKGL